ncbi:MAG: insulinase family protein [candidate division WOR-3 bacterium]|nr:insulinase family protein [candidate division WOR-3 bacterium]
MKNIELKTRYLKALGYVYDKMRSTKFTILFTAIVFSLLVFYANALPISRDSLDCGLVVLTYSTNRLPLIEIRWVNKSGSAYDPLGKEGLANLTNKMLTRGTKRRSALKLNAEVEFIGAVLSDWTSYDYSALQLRCLKKDFDLVLDILADMLINPEFSEKELARIKQQVIGDIKQSDDYPYNQGWKKFSELIFQNHPYRHPITGDTQSVAKLTIKDVADFYNQFYTIDNGFLVVVGDFDKNELLQKIENKFVNMRKGRPNIQIPNFVSGPYCERPKGYLIHQPNLNQSYIFLGFPGISEITQDENYSPLSLRIRVMNFILGGSPLTSRLGRAIREDEGLAYDIRSFFDRRLFGGLFAITTQTSDPNKAINIILRELKKMHHEGAKPKELKDAKTFYIGNFPFNFDATSEKIDLLMNLELYHKGLDYLDKFNSYIQKITLNDINNLAQKYLYPNNYLLVIVTNVTKDSLQVPELEWLE